MRDDWVNSAITSACDHETCSAHGKFLAAAADRCMPMAKLTSPHACSSPASFLKDSRATDERLLLALKPQRTARADNSSAAVKPSYSSPFPS